MKILKITTYLSSLIWFANGAITIGSIYVSSIGWFINLVIGFIFILTAIYIFLKEKSLVVLLLEIKENISTVKTVIRHELIFIFTCFFIGLVVLLAISQRVFSEGYAVFG